MSKKRKLTAFGLVEIMVAMVLTGVIITVITSFTIKAYREVKNNELADMANSTMIRAVEYFKNTKINNFPGANQTRIYRVSTALNDVNFAVVEVAGANTDPLQQANCQSSSFSDTFQVPMGSIPAFNLCNKIVVITDAAGNATINSYLVYRTTTVYYKSYMKGYIKK